MVFAGTVLDTVQTWTVFKKFPELFILVPALLGLKGNLEMTLASRLSTQANMGQLDRWSDSVKTAKANLALVQVQGIAVGGIAGLLPIVSGYVINQRLLHITKQLN